MKLTKKVAGLALASVVCGLSAYAWVQEGMPMQKPGAEHEVLGMLAGDWDADVHMGPEASKASFQVRSMDGMWFLGEFSGDLMGGPFRGHSVMGYDMAKKEYVSFWFDNMSSSPNMGRGSFDKASKKLTLKGRGKGPDGSEMDQIEVYQFKDADHVTFEMYMGQMTPEAMSFSIDYSKRKK